MLAVAAVIAAGGKSRMIACRSLFRVNLLVRESTDSYVKSKPLQLLYVQKYRFWRGFSCELKMDARKGRGDGIDRRKQKNVAQTWRAVSTQPSSSKEGVKMDVALDQNIKRPGKHSVSMEIGASLMRFVKGNGGDIQEKIEGETGAKIIFPSSRNEDSIIIEGNSAESVTQASQKIQCVIDKVVNSRDFDYSHFVSLPLAIHPGLVDKLVSFQNTILGISASDKNVHRNADRHVKVNVSSIPLVSYHPKEAKAPTSEASSSKLIELGIEKSIFINPKTFHLTVLMLKLWNKERVKTAAEVLRRVSSKVMDALENRPILIRLKGLDCMRGSLAKAYVLYAPVEEIGGEGRLLRACKVITDAFVEAGLIMEKDAQHQLKLHATLMNARHRKRKTRTRKVDSFDARGIFDLYGSEEWGKYPISEAHLSQRFVFDENGYYHCCASIPFPKACK